MLIVYSEELKKSEFRSKSLDSSVASDMVGESVVFIGASLARVVSYGINVVRVDPSSTANKEMSTSVNFDSMALSTISVVGVSVLHVAEF